MKKTIVLLLIAAMFLAPVFCFAASSWTEKDTYGGKISGKFQLGLKNTLLGWTDIFFEPIQASKKCESGDNIWNGIGRGLTDGIMNEVLGALQLVTFPWVVDIPIPENGVQFSTKCNGESTASK